MRVRTLSDHGVTRLSYSLHSPEGVVPYFHREIVGPTLQGSPDEYHSQLLQKVEKLRDRRDVDGSPLLRVQIERKMANLGRQLWRELFSSELQHAYREIRQHVHSWMIISDEPWIPWELVKPYDVSQAGETLDDDFLALRFDLTRWLVGAKTPVSEIEVYRFATIQTAKDLPTAEKEQHLLKKLAELGEDVSPSVVSASDVLVFLETSEVDLLHFVGHGVFNHGEPDESGIPFPDGSVFRPVDLEGPLATHIGRHRPMVFLNICQTAQQGWSLTRLGGWPTRWVSVCGCGAFVAPMWPVRDQAAVVFAEELYQSLASKVSLGEAARWARLKVREERPSDLSALAYSVYGHPNASVHLAMPYWNFYDTR